MKRLTLTLGLLALATVLAACSGASANTGTTPAPAGSPAGDAVSIVAKDLKFNGPSGPAVAGQAFDIAFDNQDGAPHNIDIADPSGAQVFKGDIVASQTVTYHVGPLAAGTYQFVCDVHPDMKGTITVE